MQYVDMVQLLAKPGQDILDGMTADKMHLLHMALGVAGETFELLNSTDADNFKEEAGDLLFYLVGLGVPTVEVPFSSDFEWGLTSSAESVVDQIKKYCIYGKDLDTQSLEAAVSQVMCYLECLVIQEGLTMDEIRTSNYDKLMNKRYPNGYSDAAAIARADK